jgi:hypothetical protein
MDTRRQKCSCANLYFVYRNIRFSSKVDRCLRRRWRMEVVEREHIDMVVISTHGISGWHP